MLCYWFQHSIVKMFQMAPSFRGNGVEYTSTCITNMHTASGMLQGVTWVIGLVFHHACYENICIGCLLVRASCTARSHRSAPVSDLRWSSRGLEFLISTLQRRKKASPFSIKKVLPLRFLVKVPGECSHLSLSGGSRAIGAVCELLRPPKSLCSLLQL